MSKQQQCIVTAESSAMAVDPASDHEVTLQQRLNVEPHLIKEKQTFSISHTERILTATGCKVTIRARNGPRTLTVIGPASTVELARRMALSFVTGLTESSFHVGEWFKGYSLSW